MSFRKLENPYRATSLEISALRYALVGSQRQLAMSITSRSPASLRLKVASLAIWFAPPRLSDAPGERQPSLPNDGIEPG